MTTSTAIPLSDAPSLGDRASHARSAGRRARDRRRGGSAGSSRPRFAASPREPRSCRIRRPRSSCWTCPRASRPRRTTGSSPPSIAWPTRRERYGLVLFSDTAYLALPPGTAALELRSFARFFRVPPQRGGALPEPPRSPWTDAFSAGTRISTGSSGHSRRSGQLGSSDPRSCSSATSTTTREDLARLTEAALAYRRAGIPLHVVGLNRPRTTRTSSAHCSPTPRISSRRRSARSPRIASSLDAPLAWPSRPWCSRSRSGCCSRPHPAAFGGAGARPTRIALAVCAALVAVGCRVLARDLLSWGDALDRGDRADATGDAARGSLGGASLAARRPRRRAARRPTRARAPAGPALVRGGCRSSARLRQRPATATRPVPRRKPLSRASPRAGRRGQRLRSRTSSAFSQRPSDRARATRSRPCRVRAAIRADRSNAAAAYNLELLLRRARVVGSREGARLGSRRPRARRARPAPASPVRGTGHARGLGRAARTRGCSLSRLSLAFRS